MTVRSLIRLLAAVLVAMQSAASVQPAAAEVPEVNSVWTLPETPKAGEPFRLVGIALLLGGGDFDGSATRIDVQDGTIDIWLSWSCPNAISCDFVIPMPVQIELPPLAAGVYTVRIHQFEDGSSPDLEAELTVAEATLEPSSVEPVTGWWWEPGLPGYGLILDRRGDFLGLSHFDGDGWTIATGPVVEDRFLAVDQYFSGGSCAHPGCSAAYVAPRASVGGQVLRMKFLSAREMEVEFTRGGVRRLVAMPVGGGYRSDFGSPEETARLPLPDLRGTWVFTVDPAARETYWIESQAPLTIRFETLELDPENEAPEVDLAWRGVDPSGVEAGSREYSLICRSGSPSACSLRYDGLQGLPPPSPLRQWRATLDNIARDRIEATWGQDDYLVRVRGFRLD